MKNLLLAYLLFPISSQCYSQLETFLGAPHHMMTSDFLGADFTISNVTYSGSIYAIGSFDGLNSNVGVRNGIILTTGTVIGNADGPVGPNNETNAGIDNQYSASTILSQTSGGVQTYNAASLEFDFIPSNDTFRLKYVFGSEEYPEFAPPNNSSYNDIFGIFISGPGIVGMPNIAKLPNGAVVSINTVNTIANSSFYNPNGDGLTSPQIDSPYYIQYDGFTDVLEASYPVQIGFSYHITIAIADAGDGIFDSGIFLESCESCAFYANTNELSTEETILIWPNPAADQIKIKNGTENEVEVEILDLRGQLINKLKIQSGILELDSEFLPNGIYLFRVNSNISSHTERVVIKH